MGCFWSDKNVANIANLFMVNKKELKWTEKKNGNYIQNCKKKWFKKYINLNFFFVSLCGWFSIK